LGLWTKAYPRVLVSEEILRAAAWAKANPPKKNWQRFLVNWLSRCQEKSPPIPTPNRPKMVDEVMKDKGLDPESLRKWGFK
jgi:hypothetical protein